MFYSLKIPAVMIAIAFTAPFSSSALADVTIQSDVNASTLKKSKTTHLGKYLTPKAAHAALQVNPEIFMIDVRDPIEISFVGHPFGMDNNTPIALASHSFNAKTGTYSLKPNPNFLKEITAAITRAGKGKSDPIFVTCRSGGRSAAAAKVLIKAGYTNVWNLTEGFEGDKAKSGARAKNGWRNAGLPWSYNIPAKAAWVPVK